MECYFIQDGWGGQNVKQDTSWDVGIGGGSAVPESSLPPIAVKQQVCNMTDTVFMEATIGYGIQIFAMKT